MDAPIQRESPQSQGGDLRACMKGPPPLPTQVRPSRNRNLKVGTSAEADARSSRGTPGGPLQIVGTLVGLKRLAMWSCLAKHSRGIQALVLGQTLASNTNAGKSDRLLGPAGPYSPRSRAPCSASQVLRGSSNPFISSSFSVRSLARKVKRRVKLL